MQNNIWKTILENAPDYIMQLDRNLRIQYLNVKFIPGLDTGKAYLDHIPPAYHQEVSNCFDTVKSTGSTASVITQYATGSKEPLFYEVRASPLHDEEKMLTGYITVSSDVTERILALKKVEESEERFRVMMERAPEAIVIFNVDTGKFIDANDNATKMFSLSYSELCQYGPVELSPHRQPDGELSEHKAINLIQDARKGKADAFEWVHIHPKTGEPIICEIRLCLLPWAGTTVMRGSLLDITERKQLEQQLARHRDELENLVNERTAELQDSLDALKKTRDELIIAEQKATRASSAKSQFLAQMSHEIRTPMNGIISMSDLLLEEPLNEKQQRFAAIIKESSTSLLTILNDILDISKIEEGKLQLDLHNFSLPDALTSVFDIFAAEIQKKTIDYKLSMAPNIPEQVTADSVRIKQILINLINNAIKFTPENGKISITASCYPVDNRICTLKVTVKDNGIGIAKSKQSILFDTFSQADKSTTRQFGGTGLGLPISKTLCELMDGRIELHSSEGQGTEVNVFLPVVITRQTETPLQENNAGQDANTPVDCKVLIAEDNPTNQKVAIALFQHLGLAVTLVENGREAIDAIDAIDAHKYDLVLMDCQMPVMDGYTAAREIRKTFSGEELPIIAITASATIEEQEKCLASGMNDMLAKPVELKSLKAVLAKWQKKQPA